MGDCAFQYFNGVKIVHDYTGLTLQEAKDKYNDNLEQMITDIKGGFQIEVAIWINMKTEIDFNDTLLHLSSSDIYVDDDGDIYTKNLITKLK